MKAVTIIPGKKGSLELSELKKPDLHDIEKGKGVLVKVLRTGIGGTDKEIMDAGYGKSPTGDNYLIMGHESLGIVTECGPNVKNLKRGDLVVATVRRPGNSIYDRIGLQDFTVSKTYYEHGISKLHGFLTEYYTDNADFLIKIPDSLKEVAILLEPLSIVEKGISQAYEIQKRLKVWEVKKAAVIGVGPIGLLAAMLLRLKNIETFCFARTQKPYIRAEMAERLGAFYTSTREMDLLSAVKEYGPFDLVFEASGNPGIFGKAAQAPGKNGVLILSGISNGSEQKTEVAADKINLDFVLGNKLMFGTVNASQQDFENALRDMALCETVYPGWLSGLITHRIKGLDKYRQISKIMEKKKELIKLVVEIQS